MVTFNTKEKFVKKNKSSDLKNHIFYVNQIEYERIIASVKKFKSGKKDVPIPLIEYFLYNSTCYDILINCFIHHMNFELSYKNGQCKGDSFVLTNSEIIDSIIIYANMYDVDFQVVKRIKTLYDLISVKQFFIDHSNSVVNYTIEGENYQIKVNNFLRFICLDDMNYNRILSDPKITLLYGMPKLHFIYALANYMTTNKIVNNYYLDSQIEKKIIGILSMQKIDYEAVNTIYETDNDDFNHIVINKKLEKAILKNIPRKYTALEKAIYIYIKMCKLLTYNDEYYAVNQKGVAVSKHQSLDYIKNITLKNNEVVCYEFNVMYSKFLNKLGINFIINGVYGHGHSNITFRFDKFLIDADSTTTIIKGDFFNAKRNLELNGLICKNKNNKTKMEFMNILNKVYEEIKKQESTLLNNQDTLEELLLKYKDVIQDYEHVSISEKLSIINDKLESSKLVGIDAISYLMQLKKILFTDDELIKNFNFTIIRENEENKDVIASTAVIIYTNELNFEEEPKLTKFYYYKPNALFEEITFEALQKYFNLNKYSYIKMKDPDIPGIIGGIRR